ncbi:MAG TPA: S8 family serine peptidase, partial [Dehalococcoidia bacterium]|nr:S8 family serine peptidase [Dehalococcoidia bacterium]
MNRFLAPASAALILVTLLLASGGSGSGHQAAAAGGASPQDLVRQRVGAPSGIAAAVATPQEELEEAVRQGRLDRAVLDAILADGQVDAILVVDSSTVTAAFRDEKVRRGLTKDDADILRRKAAAFATLKTTALARAAGAAVVLRDYTHFALQHVRFRSEAALAAVLRDPSVAVAANRFLELSLGQSLPLIGQPAAESAGHTGTGATVAILDTEVNELNSAFGCTAVGTPATCKVAVKQDFAPGSSACSAHGTNVAAIAVGVAPGAKVAGLDVFQPVPGPPCSLGAATSDIVSALNWVIDNQSAHNIVAANMSLGSPETYFTVACSLANPYLEAFAGVREAGVLPIVSSGNDAYALGGFTNGISSPACTPGAVSVGAVYDANIGGVAYSDCTDFTTAADQITCFSQSASILSLLAPGARITAAGFPMYGTSQAAPHVSGAVAVLAGASPSSTVAQREAALTGTGPQITDPRNGVT